MNTFVCVHVHTCEYKNNNPMKNSIFIIKAERLKQAKLPDEKGEKG